MTRSITPALLLALGIHVHLTNCTNTQIPLSRSQQWVNKHGWNTDQTLSNLSNNTTNCTVSTMTRWDMARRRHQKNTSFSTSPLHHLEMPRIGPLNSTSGEQWEFDGISADGTQSFIFGFSRDPNWAFMGTGNLRMYAEFSLRDSDDATESPQRRYAIVDYAEESTVKHCPGVGTRGVWKGDGFEYSFEISDDMSRAVVQMRNPEADVTVKMNSVAKPRYADNTLWPAKKGGSVTAVSHFFWAEPIPAADLTVEGTIEGRSLQWGEGGMGGHERLWHAFNWPTCLTGMLAVRLRVGPYALSLVEFTSSRVAGLRVPSVILAQDGETIFTSREEHVGVEYGDESGFGDYLRVVKLYEGKGITTPQLKDKVTGMELTLVSPSKKKQWRFVVTHKNVGFEYAFTDGSGGTGYSGVAEGGLVGSGKSWLGPAFVEVMSFPEKSLFITKNYVE